MMQGAARRRCYLPAMPRRLKLPLAVWAWWHRHVVLPRAPRRLAAQRREVVERCPAMAGVFQALEQGCGPWTPTQLSFAERQRRGVLADATLTYGEVEWRSFVDLVGRAEPRREDRFVELGCGTAQFSLYMHLHHGIAAVGVEAVHALAVLARSLAGPRLGAGVEVLEGDFLARELPRGTLYWATTTCLPGAQRGELGRRLAASPPGARVVCVGQPIGAPGLVLRERARCRASWGREDAWIYARAAD